MTRPLAPRRVATWTARVAAWTVIVAIAGALTAAVLVPRIAGATPYTVLTGSMTPTYAPGTLVVVKPVDARSLASGDVITYQLESGKPTVVTHRVVGQGYDGTGEVVLRTQGDANSSPDPQLVKAVQVRGEVWYSVPFLGHVNNVLTGSQRQAGVYLAAAGLMGYALLLWLGAARDHSRRRKEWRHEASRPHAPTPA